jgi:alpha-galactosidase
MHYPFIAHLNTGCQSRKGTPQMTRKKITIIGAGSAVFTKGLVVDLILSPAMGPWELGLVDIDPQALAVADGLSRRLIDARGADIAVHSSIDRRDVLPGSDVVVVTIGVGGRRGWEQDVFIPRKYGVFQPVGDSVMPGGISRAMRMIPALVDIARDVQALCPAAHFFNYSNPMTANCWAIIEATGIPVVGLCHGVFHVQGELAQLVGAPRHEVSALAVGLNHLTFFTGLRWQGRDMFPMLREKVAEVLHPASGEPTFPDAGQIFVDGITVGHNPFSWSLFEAYGAYPSANDRHVVEFFPERFPQGQYYGKVLGIDAYSLEEIIELGDQGYARMGAQARGEEPLESHIFERKAGEHEQLLAILHGIEQDNREVFSANLPNRGAVPNLPADAILELPAIATAGGLRALQILDFPDTLAAIISRKLAATRLTVAAALAGDRRLFVEALLADGAVTDRTTAEKMMYDLLAAHRDYLPNFF